MYVADAIGAKHQILVQQAPAFSILGQQKDRDVTHMQLDALICQSFFSLIPGGLVGAYTVTRYFKEQQAPS